MKSNNKVKKSIEVVSKIEKWYLKNFKKIDPMTERIVRFYTYSNQQGQDFEFECPTYKYDIIDCLYDEFVKVSQEVGKKIQTQFGGGVPGKYYYDVKIVLSDSEFWFYGWEILKTDNPRCLFGNPMVRKNCSYITNQNSRLMIDGYYLSGNYKSFAGVLSELIGKTIVVHSKYDAKALLRILKFFGVGTVKVADSMYYNNPNKRCYFSRNAYSYRLAREGGQTVIRLIPKNELAVAWWEVLDIDEFIVKRSLRARLRDWR